MKMLILKGELIMDFKRQLTKKRFADISLKETSEGEYENIGPKENNKPKHKKGK
jgi:hypothetical protein